MASVDFRGMTRNTEVLLENKVAIVTGGARGIGFAIARRFLEDGTRVVVADVDVAAGSAAVEELGSLGAVRFVACDVGDSAAVDNLVAAAIAAFGEIDILVNNAAILVRRDFLDVAEEEFDRVIRTNLKGAFLTGQAVARHMVDRVKAGGAAGAIVNLSSVNAVFAIANQVPYSVSKGGINQLTKVMALALAEHGIRVNAIGPGSIMTDMLATAMADEDARRRLLSRTPLGRLGDPKEIAAIAAFLASDEASYITGQTIYADGGRLPLNYTVPVKD
jgi:NAD(P)-dependent dehydrogenase (short-subunit alcohol dehydrogenase family)